MKTDRKIRRTGRRTLLAIAFLLAPICARADETPDYRNITHFHVEYQDASLGVVTGEAFCKWAPDFDWATKGRDLFGDGRLYGPGVYGNSTEKQAHCKVRLYNPQTGATSDLTAVGADLKEPYDSQGHYLPEQGVQIVLHGQSPSAGPVSATNGQPVSGVKGSTGRVTLKVEGREVTIDAPIMPRAAVDDAKVTLDFAQQSGGTLAGGWSYEPDMISERDAHGQGRAGILLPQRDTPVATGTSAPHSGGFKGVERGHERWSPLTPRIYAVHVVEDQAGFDKGQPKFSLYDIRQTSTLNRTLIIFGRDLPVVDGEDFAGIRSKSPDGLAYTVIADSLSKSLAPEHKQLIAQAIADESTRVPTLARTLPTMQAVVVKVEQRVLREPGPRIFDWDGATWEWPLQYGDNTVALQFRRIVRVNDHPSQPLGSNEDPRFTRPTAANQPLDQTEQVLDLAMPDRVVVEVTTGGPIPLQTLPVVLGGPALGGKTIDLVATRLPDRPLVYRTPPIVVAENGASPALDGGGTLVTVTKGAKLLAKVDESKTHFLRHGVATANTTPSSDVWGQALGKAGSCRGRTFDPKDWPNFAKQTTETLSNWLSYDVTYGDHAAMLILRDASVRSLRRVLGELSAVAAEKVGAQPAEELIDGWYRSVHDLAVAPNSPLGAVEVDSPAGKVPYAQAYSQAFEIGTFHTTTDPDGENRFRTWRREAAHAALDNYRGTLADAIDADNKIDNCDREGLLKLTGAISAGSPRTAPDGKRSSGLVTSIAPLLMKSRAPNAVAEPDLIARAYVDTIDQLVLRMQTVNDFASQLNRTIITAASMIVALPGAASLGSMVVVEVTVGGETVAAAGLSLSLGGLVNFSYMAGNDIYENYQAHADVAFAYAHYQTLGIDQYLDAQSKSQPWWQTIVKVFGDAIVSFAHPGPGKAQLYEEGPLLERGAKVAERLLKDDTLRVSQLEVEDQAAFALFHAKQEEILASRGVLTRADKASKAVLARLAPLSLAAPAPAAAESVEAAVERRIEEQAIAAVADPVPLGKPPAAELDKQAASADLFADAEAAASEDAALRAESPANPPAPPSGAAAPATVHDVPFLAEKGKELPVGTYSIGKEGRPTITVDITDYTGAGEFATVYRINGRPQGLPASLSPALSGKPLVIKFLKNTNTDLLFADIAQGTGERLALAETLLGKGVDEVPNVAFQVFPEDGIVIQEYVEIAKGNKIPSPGEFLKPEYDAQRRAVAKLVKKLIDRKLRWRDIQPGNIFLAKEGDEFVAKILDADFISHVGDQPLATETMLAEANAGRGGGTFLSYWEAARGAVPPPIDPEAATAQQMIQLEQNGALQFSVFKGVDQPGWLKPSDFDGLVEWPGFKPLPAEAPPPPLPLPPPEPKPLPLDLSGMQRPILDLDFFRRLPLPGKPPPQAGAQ